MKTRIQSYIEQFTQLYDGDPWLDETFNKKLDDLDEEQAFTKAPGNNHSVAEVVSHLIEWRKEYMRGWQLILLIGCSTMIVGITGYLLNN